MGALVFLFGPVLEADVCYCLGVLDAMLDMIGRILSCLLFLVDKPRIMASSSSQVTIRICSVLCWLTSDQKQNTHRFGGYLLNQRTLFCCFYRMSFFVTRVLPKA
uniref:Secreted protein n=1 Tax=Setaria viridis TaxID=4556 RepID=A0A4U6T9K0_SETVI|nr:hypothetical protein SEVIR_9G571500v2 [Setaria viridis]